MAVRVHETRSDDETIGIQLQSAVGQPESGADVLYPAVFNEDIADFVSIGGGVDDPAAADEQVASLVAHGDYLPPASR